MQRTGPTLKDHQFAGRQVPNDARLGVWRKRGVRDLISILKYRGFVWRRAWTDVRHRFAGTGAGVLWNVLNPLATISLYAVIFSKLLGPRIPELSSKGPLAFTLYLWSGMLPWLAFSDRALRAVPMHFRQNVVQFLKKLVDAGIPIHRRKRLYRAELAWRLVSRYCWFSRFYRETYPRFSGWHCQCRYFVFCGSVTELRSCVDRCVYSFQTSRNCCRWSCRSLAWLAPVVYVASIVPKRVAGNRHLAPHRSSAERHA